MVEHHPGVSYSPLQESKFLLRFINPRDTAVKISLTELPSTVTADIVAKEFTLEAFNEMSEYDNVDDETEEVTGPGVFRSQKNIKSIIVVTRPNDQKSDLAQVCPSLSPSQLSEHITLFVFPER